MSELPTREALRTILDVTVHAGICETVLRAYADGILMTADEWRDSPDMSPKITHPELIEALKITPSELAIRRIKALEERALKLEEADEACAAHQLKQMEGT